MTGSTSSRDRDSRGPILVTGATGNVGRRLIDALRTQGAAVRAVTRDRRAAALPSGVEVVEADPSRPETMTGALDGVSDLFLNPMAVQSGVEELLSLCQQHGVRRVVTLSAINLHDDPLEQPSRMRGVDHAATEAACLCSGLTWVALRIGTLAVNSMPMWAEQLRAGEIVRGPHMASAGAPLHERDVAEVAAIAHLTGRLDGAGRAHRSTVVDPEADGR